MTNYTTVLSWVVPCNPDFALAITIGSDTYRLKKEQLISLDSTGTVCTSLVKGWADPAVRSYLFGAPFATSAYIAYNAQQDKSGDQIGVAPRAGGTINVIDQRVSSTLVGAIVGSVLGATLIVCVVLFFFIYRRRRSPSDIPSSNKRRLQNMFA